MKRPSVRPIIRPRMAGLLLSAVRAADINRQQQAPRAYQQRRSAANASSVTFTADVGG